ncbi:MAG TPA: TrpB-like pyridoxal phosphate-dependent enzyme [Brevefilum fermentans]|jgi:tryptophan synthase beta chain|uniref:Tryptophan synthase beta chain n=1 Tax=Candidatus Brevifilum fermentans TaxID=1986204 RepID=A0A1Y6K6V6_9CHLR|nr:TrpB-like pyridoxal phosphate-dependent enzyme [Brevefilum fermentans]MDI9565443.1 TrpB-like pyridoxal phosphate-dependent enzyme [Chloroflexota bacterium]SMX53780.1 Tryptophan synthase beta chain 2 [Brevefilum fermentans]HOM66746.1 TrpB-like pyridoxal phosphate-dependent enzyme [Brevefilum fermentans]HQA27733.1 TrpB-like pyridoxal phosphate-dependent enzyme [Brevefilum fermentans]
MNNEHYKYLLTENDLPKSWYNINADMPVPLTPVLNPQTREPITAEFLNVLFPMSLIEQEMSTDRYIDIPEEVREIYKLWRPTPLLRARRLEKALGTPAHIYYKNEGASITGSHKTNTAVAQAFYNKIDGTRSLTTETGAGQWGAALAVACKFFDMNLEVFMVRGSFYDKPYRRIIIESYDAEIFPSPSDRTDYGRKYLQENPEGPGSLGIAISEAVETAVKSNGEKKYSLGSVLNHVLLHQTVIGQECLKQMEMADEYPDVVIACCGGGSNFGGIAFPFLHRNLTEGLQTRIVAVEPQATPTLTKGLYAFDYGDTAKMAPILKMFTLGHDFIPAPIHAGGLRYHGMAPQICMLYDAGYIEAVAIPQLETFEAGVLFAQTEGIIPAPESSHAIRAAIDEALDAKEKGEERVILFNLSGHGLLDLSAYDAYHQGQLVNDTLDVNPEEIRKMLPKVDF